MVENLVYSWYDRAQVDYSDQYMRLYVAFNAWYRKATGSSFDREGLVRLKKRFVIWDDYLNDSVMVGLKPLHKEILGNDTDWQGLIDYWYSVRCQLFHGSLGPDDHTVRLAYESLNIFMGEIVARMRRAFTDEDHRRLRELEALLEKGHPKMKYLEDSQLELHRKYLNAPHMWNVDMIRVKKE